MGDPETKKNRSRARQRNFIAKTMRENMPKKIHKTEKDREKQRKWRFATDPDSDYENVDDWIMRNNDVT